MLPPRALCLLLCGFCLAGCAQQDEYPARPITVICPWSPGGGTDAVARQMAFFLEHELQVPCTVINATGGQGVTGHRRGLLATPDGYTVATITFELNTLHWQRLTSLTFADADPLISVNEDAAAIWVRADAPWQTLDDLRQEIERRPGELTASGTATGGAWHLALAGWLQSAGLSPEAVKWVPKGGADPSIQELMSDGLDLVCCSLPEAKLRYERGELRALAVFSEERAPGFDEIPTAREQGFDWTLVGWRGFAVPVGTPPDRADILRQAMQKIVRGEVEVDGQTFPDFMHQRGFNNRWRDRDDFLAFLRQNDETLGELLNGEAFRTLAEGRIGPYAFPILLAIALGCLALLQALRPQPTVAADSPAEPATPPATAPPRNTRDGAINVGFAVGAVLAYLFLAETVGFVLLTGGLLIALLLRLGTRPIPAVLLTLLLVPGVYQLFAGFLRVPLPRGWWGW